MQDQNDFYNNTKDVIWLFHYVYICTNNAKAMVVKTPGVSLN